eukprot:gene5221-18449_t
MSSPIHEKDALNICGCVPKVEQDVKPSVQGNWISYGNADGGRTMNLMMDDKGIPASQAVKYLESTGNWTANGDADGGRTMNLRMNDKGIPASQAMKYYESVVRF